MRIPIFLLTLVAFTGLAYADDPDDQAPAPTAAAAPATPPPPPAKYGGWAFSGLIDGYITDNYNHPISNLNQLQNFDLMWGQPLINMAKFTIDKSDSVIGVHVDVGVGEAMRLIHAADPAAKEHQGLRYFEQMYLIAKPKHFGGTEIDFGQFVTSAGAEVIESPANWNYTRSLLFAWAIPYYHFGIKTNTPINKVVSVGFQLVNPWNTVSGDHAFTNIGVTVAVTKGPVSWFTNYYVGKNHPVIGNTAANGVRNLIDSTLLISPTDKTSFYINADYGRDHDDFGGGYASWEGIAFAARQQVTKKVAIAGRAEHFKDSQGYSTGTPQSLDEATMTGEYKLNGIFMTRLEYRHDSSNVKFFDRGTVPGARYGMSTVTLGITASLGPWK